MRIPAILKEILVCPVAKSPLEIVDETLYSPESKMSFSLESLDFRVCLNDISEQIGFWNWGQETLRVGFGKVISILKHLIRSKNWMKYSPYMNN